MLHERSVSLDAIGDELPRLREDGLAFLAV
jgi:hypothetical protein